MIPYITFNDFLVFLEGIQVPVTSIEVAYGRGSSVCSLAIVPNVISQKIYPLTRVHVFYKFDGKYRLLFDGRIVDIRYVRTPTRMDTVLVAYDFTSFLSTIPVFFYTLSGEGAETTISLLLGENQTILAPFGAIDTTLFKMLSEDGKPLSIHRTIQEFLNKIFVKKRQEIAETTIEEPLISQYSALYIPVMGDKAHLRFAALTTSNLYQTIRQQLWNDLVENRLGAQDSKTSIMGFITQFLEVLGMTWFSFSGLKYYNQIVNVLILPYLFGARIPDCNVISQMTYCNIIQNKINQPTRVMYRVPLLMNVPATTETKQGEGGEETSQQDHYTYLIYPEWIANKLQSKEENVPFFQKYYSIITAEEAIRGIVPVELALPMDFSKSNEISSDSEVKAVNEQTHDFAKKQIVYDFYNARLSQSSIAISMIFNPFLVPGFPALVYDKDNEFTGKFLPIEVRHTISAEGVETTINGAYYHGVNEISKISAIASKISPDLVDPSGFYSALGIYDKNNVFTYKGNTLEFDWDNIKKLTSIKIWMLYAKNRYIVTMEDFASFVGIVRKEYSLGQRKIYYFDSELYYNKNRRAVVEEMVQELLMKKIRMG